MSNALLKILKEFFKKALQFAALTLFMTALLTAYGKKQEATTPKPSYSYKDYLVYTTEMLSDELAGSHVVFCTLSGMLTEIHSYRYNHSTTSNIFDRKTSKPVFCDPATGKVLE